MSFMNLFRTLLILITGSIAARADEPFDPEPVVALFELVAENTDDPQAARECLSVLAEKVQTRELTGQPLDAIRKRLRPSLEKILDNKQHPLFLDAALLSAAWKDEKAVAAVRNLL